MSRHGDRSPAQRRVRGNWGAAGFTLLEILVALAIMGMLMALVGQIMSQVVDSSAQLRQRLANAGDLVAVRRLLHRDLMDCQDKGSLEASRSGFSFPSTHNFFLDGTLPLVVTWSFDDHVVTRTEEDKELNYTRTIPLLHGVRGWILEYYVPAKIAWLPHDTLRALQKAEQMPRVNALRLTVVFEDGNKEVLVERVNAR